MDDKIKDRFSLRSYAIMYELPTFDVNNTELTMELGQKLTDIKNLLVDKISHGIEFFKSGEMTETEDGETLDSVKAIESYNILLLYQLVVRVDTNLVDPDSIEKDWSRIKEEIESTMTEFFKSHNLIFRIIKEA